MKVEIFFVLFESPDHPWGDFKGLIDLPSPPVVGDQIAIVADSVRAQELGLPAKLRVTSVDRLNDREGPAWLAQLQDVIVGGRVAARSLAELLERDTDLFCWVYKDEPLDSADDE